MDCFQGMPLVRGWTLSYDSERLDRCHPVGASRKFLKAGGHNLELQPPPNPGSQMPAHLPFDLWLRCFSHANSRRIFFTRSKLYFPQVQITFSLTTEGKMLHDQKILTSCRYDYPSRWSFGGDYGIYKCLGLFIPCASSSSCLLLSHYITWDKILQGLTPRGRIITIYLSSLLWISLAPSDIFGLILQTTVLICYTRLCTYFFATKSFNH